MTPKWRLVLLVLAAPGCSPLSPEARCFADATIAYRAAWREAQAIRADLARGYAVHSEDIRTVVAVPCRVAGARSACLGNTRDRIKIPLATDRVTLTNRLAALEVRMEALRPAAMEGAARCGYGNGANGDAPGGG